MFFMMPVKLNAVIIGIKLNSNADCLKLWFEDGYESKSISY